jgi:hypothetical protein
MRDRWENDLEFVHTIGTRFENKIRSHRPSYEQHERGLELEPVASVNDGRARASSNTAVVWFESLSGQANLLSEGEASASVLLVFGTTYPVAPVRVACNSVACVRPPLDTRPHESSHDTHMILA